MIRVLVMIAIAGFVLSIATISAAVAIGGPDLIARGGWALASGGWDDGHWNWGRHHGRDVRFAGDGPQSSRTLTWSGADSLNIDLPADVRYIQQAGPGSVVVTGPTEAVNKVIVRGDSIRYLHGYQYHHPKLIVVVRAPGISSFDVNGRNTLSIEGYHQDHLRLDISGDADVNATGETDDVDLDISGNSDVDLGALKAKGAEVDISGSADVTLAPTEWAKLDVSGAGDVRLLTHPGRLETDVSGAGRVRQEEPSASPSPPPSPSPSPSPKSSKL
jgi:hypothetical protein